MIRLINGYQQGANCVLCKVVSEEDEASESLTVPYASQFANANLFITVYLLF